jgi:hypothetical protein
MALGVLVLYKQNLIGAEFQAWQLIYLAMVPPLFP